VYPVTVTKPAEDNLSQASSKKSASVGRKSNFRTFNRFNLLAFKPEKVDKTASLKVPSPPTTRRVRSEERCKLYLSDMHRGKLKDDQSIIGDERDEFNRLPATEISALEVSIRPFSRDRSIARPSRFKSQSKSASKFCGKSTNKSCVLEDDKEPRVNSDLNTTYIRNIERVAPMKLKLFKAMGYQISGPRTKINDYVLLKTIGSGGWSEEVYLAVQSETKQKFAVKVINLKALQCKIKSEAYLKTVKNEIEVMKALDNPHFVKLHEALQDDVSNKIYLVMELCSKGCILSDTYWKAEDQSDGNSGMTLLLELNKSISFGKLKHYLRQAAEGLYYCRFALLSTSRGQHRPP
jgi:hypothetical protein